MRQYKDFEIDDFEDDFDLVSADPRWPFSPVLQFLRKFWIVLAALLVLIVVFTCVHVWSDGSCTEDIKCRICGKVNQTAREHQWNEATCSMPKTCRICNETEGSALPHSWKAATCTDPQRCIICGIQEGEPSEHGWMEPTYQSGSTCLYCGATWGRSLPYMLTWCPAVEDSNETNSTTDVQRGSFTDVNGNVYSDALRFWVADFSGWANTEYIVYELDADYELMEFSIAADKDNHERGETKILIYGDDQLLYESSWIGNEPGLSFASVYIQGVKKLRIECTTDSDVHCYCILEAKLYQVADI